MDKRKAKCISLYDRSSLKKMAKLMESREFLEKEANRPLISKVFKAEKNLSSSQN